MNIKDALHEASKILKKNEIISFKLDSEILMSKVFKRDRKFIILNVEKELKKDDLDEFNTLIKERSYGKPISYILGKKDFWKYEFEVRRDVLIPRPDTEIIVEETLKTLKNKSSLKILDIGIGSGCILLSILKEKKKSYGVGIDISKKCLDLSEINALKHGVRNRVKFYKSDIDNFNYGKYDLIISNPPYIKHIDYKYLDKDIKRFEPKLALDGGLDGLSEIRKVVKKSSKLIKTNGKLILEIGFDQKKEVKKILNSKGFYINKIIKDYAKNNRCIISTKINS